MKRIKFFDESPCEAAARAVAIKSLFPQKIKVGPTATVCKAYSLSPEEGCSRDLSGTARGPQCGPEHAKVISIKTWLCFNFKDILVEFPEKC